MLAPKDIQPYLFSHKDNTHGLGYSGIDPTTAMFGGEMKVTTFKPTGKEKKGIKGQVCVMLYSKQVDDLSLLFLETFLWECVHHYSGNEFHFYVAIVGLSHYLKGEGMGTLEKFIREMETISVKYDGMATEGTGEKVDYSG